MLKWRRIWIFPNLRIFLTKEGKDHHTNRGSSRKICINGQLRYTLIIVDKKIQIYLQIHVLYLACWLTPVVKLYLDKKTSQSLYIELVLLNYFVQTLTMLSVSQSERLTACSYGIVRVRNWVATAGEVHTTYKTNRWMYLDRILFIEEQVRASVAVVRVLHFFHTKENYKNSERSRC